MRIREKRSIEEDHLEKNYWEEKFTFRRKEFLNRQIIYDKVVNQEGKSPDH